MFASRGMVRLQWLAAAVAACCVHTAVAVSRTPSPSPVVFPLASSWKYRDDNVNPGDTKPWTRAEFDDSSWASGPAVLGFGFPGNITTTLSTASRSTAFYFRRNITGTATTVTTARLWRMHVIADDGCVVFLNGKEAFRYNMPAGAIVHKTLASVGITSTIVSMTPQIFGACVVGVRMC